MKVFYENRKCRENIFLSHNLTFNAHMHEEVEIVYMIEGTAHAFSGGVECNLSPGDFFVAFPNHVHYYDNCQDNVAVVAIIPLKVLSELRGILTTKSPLSPHIKNADPLAGKLFESALLYKGKYKNEAEKETIVDNSAKITDLEAKVKELEALLKEKDDSHLRMAAEYDNFRRRSKEEREALYTEAVGDTVGELLPIIDNLERACGFDDGEKVKEGLVMILKSVETVFEKLGVSSVGAIGESFDPNLHNAVLHDEDETKGEVEIVDVFQKGYKKGNKMIRFAMVKTVN